MSGGVDSSVAACLLLEQGYEVVGSHMSLVHLEGVEHGCCGPAARADAAAVARVAGFRFEVCDLTLDFDEAVLDDYAGELAAGRTPNPCARCNGEIKFGAFLRRADELGVDAVATGHYVRSGLEGDGRWHLRRGADPGKDQTYMLHMLGQEQLARSFFPVGVLTKRRTRELAARFGLPVATKPDSQELCFAPSGDAGGFARSQVPSLVREGGEIVDPEGRVLGEHDGTFAFTVGQRRGLGVATGSPLYVLEVDAATNRVVVGPGELLARAGLVADRASWIAGMAPEGPFEATVRVRYRGDDVAAVVTPTPGGFEVAFAAPQRAIAPGQSAVVYRDDELLGGGRIVAAAPSRVGAPH
jgi:tRNA-uridine 2-sulfurtransferase